MSDLRQMAFEEKLRYTKFDPSPRSSHTMVVDLVQPGTSVLEFGCATGYMSEVLKGRLGCTVTGLEISREAAELAREHCDRLIVGDAEQLDFDELFHDEQFDTVLFADVLEHLRDPGEVLRRIRPFLSERGAVVASIPNVAHGSVRLALLAGEFRYRELGLLDETHLRFFTREGIQDLFEASGYVITDWHRRRLELSESEIELPPRPWPDDVRALLAGDPEITTYQFVVRAVRSDESSMLRAAHEQLRELPGLRARVEEQDFELEGLRKAHEVRGRRLVAERAAFAEHAQGMHDEVTQLKAEIEWRAQAMDSLTEESQWRKEVTEQLEGQLAAIRQSLVFRVLAPLGRTVRRLGRRSR